ncbi:hypothetical protein DTO169C6_217 [Paecilomyces variotii]|nr:hypothetical protein DTO169C6_217 [Paecilomyces variotii]KAJ9294459.1 hypothetical protein DTO217A2_9171 [Paecilomyces variotii]
MVGYRYLFLAIASVAAGAPASGGTGTLSLPSVTQIPAIETQAPNGTASGAGAPLVTSATTVITTHGPYSGTPTTTGAEQGPATISATIPSQPNPPCRRYMPAGGVGTNGTLPVYMVQSDYDYQSIALGIHQEFIELDLFHYGAQVFSEQDFIDTGLTAEDRALLHNARTNYPFKTVREFIEFNVRLTRWGESGNWGFLSHLDSKEVATLLVQAEAIEARQQSVFRQWLGLHPMPIWFAPGIPQSWHWTLLSQYISSCPENNTRLVWQNFPSLHVVNQPNVNRISPNNTADFEVVGNRTGDPSKSNIPEDQSCVHVNVTGYDCGPAISRVRNQPLSFPGREVFLEWDDPGKAVGPNNSYITSTTADQPEFVAWLSQLNLTYTPLNITGPNSGTTFQPAANVFDADPALNGTAFIAVTDTDLYVTPYNLTLLNPHVRALGLYYSGQPITTIALSEVCISHPRHIRT